MTICQPCRNAADGKTANRPHCPVCGRQVEVMRTDVPPAEQRLYAHGARGNRCSGGKGAPVYLGVGHDDCNGCPCQHREKGAWKNGRR
jgi:hypothetical protein